jgi:membrane protein
MFSRILGIQISERLGFISSFAAALAFYFLMALVPLLALAIIGSTYVLKVNVSEEFLELFHSILPVGVTATPEGAERTINHFTQGNLALISTLLAIWTATNFMNELARAVHFILADRIDPRAGGIKRRLKSILLLFLWLGTLVLSALLLVVAPFIELVLARMNLVPEVSGLMLTWFRYAGAFCILLLAMRMTYALIPSRRLRSKTLWQGALIGTLGWIGSSYAFPWIIVPMWQKSYVHGALGTVLLTMFWAYICAWAFLLGAIWIKRFSRELEE